MATVEQSEQIVSSVMVEVGRGGFAASARVAGRGFSAALRAVRRAAEEITRAPAAPGGRRGGGVTMRQFVDTLGSEQREVIELDDPGVRRQLSRELTSMGVTFTTQAGVDGATYVHVRGKDAKVVAHGLDQAMKKVDQRRLRAAAARERVRRGVSSTRQAWRDATEHFGEDREIAARSARSSGERVVATAAKYREHLRSEIARRAHELRQKSPEAQRVVPDRSVEMPAPPGRK